MMRVMKKPILGDEEVITIHVSNLYTVQPGRHTVIDSSMQALRQA